MPRKGRGIYKRNDNRWEGRYIASYNTEGRAQYRSVYGRSCTEVRIKLENHAKPTHPKSIDISLTDWIGKYLEAQGNNIKISTAKIYERYLNGFIKPFFGNIALYKLNREHLQSFVNSLSDFAPSTVKGIFSFLRKCLKKASKDGYIMPIWLDVELPKVRNPEVEAFTRDEQNRIEKVLNPEENPNDIGFLICLYTGLRIGEVCGLRWSDIDFESGYLTVNRTVQRMTIDGKSVLREMPPKSGTSRRRIPVPSCLLKHMKKVQKYRKSIYVLSTGYHMMDPRTFQYQFKKLLERAGVRSTNAHTLRHTFSVRALELGFDIKTLSEILGHSDATITLKTYAHSLDEHKRSSMEKFADMAT